MWRLASIVGVLALLTWTAGSHAQDIAACASSGVDDLGCGAQGATCTITERVDVPDGCSLEFGETQHVIFTKNVATTSNGASFSISAGSLTLQTAKLQARGVGGGGTIQMTLAGLFRMTGNGVGVDVSGQDGGNGGTFNLMAGSISVEGGFVRANGSGPDADGGTINLLVCDPVPEICDLEGSCVGEIVLDGEVMADGGSADASGGSLRIRSGSLVASDDLTARGNGGGGGSINIEVATGNAEFTEGGSVRTPGGGTSGADGGDIDVTVCAGGVVMDTIFDLRGASPDGSGGALTVLAGSNVVVGDRVEAGASGLESGGGDVEITTAGRFELSGVIDTSGGGGADAFTSGDVMIVSQSGLSIVSSGAIRARGADPSIVTVSLQTAATMTIDGVVDVSATNSAGGGGEVLLQGCTVSIGGTVNASGNDGPGNIAVTSDMIRVRANARVLVTDCLDDDPENQCTVFTLAQGAPDIDAQATVNPAPLVQISGEPLCDCMMEGICAEAFGNCAVGVCDDEAGCILDRYTAAGISCDDSNACTMNESCDGAGSCVPETTVDCADGLFCNGEETCDPADGACIPGTPVDPDDGDACTDDACDEDTDRVTNTPNTTNPICNIRDSDGGCSLKATPQQTSYDGLAIVLLLAVLMRRRRG